jgi:AcrR family transcriptional regulator
VSAGEGQTGWRGEPLPRGRHKLSRKVVRESQRERILRAMVELVAEHGYAATTVPNVVAAARVSRNAFYHHFADKTECFIAVCDEVARELLDGLYAFAAEETWIDAHVKGMDWYLAFWKERPAFSRAYFLELPTAGERAIAQRERAYAEFRAMFVALGERARAEHPELPPLSPLVPRALVPMITELLAEEVRAGRTDKLDELRDELVPLTLRLLASDAVAEAHAKPAAKRPRRRRRAA